MSCTLGAHDDLGIPTAHVRCGPRFFRAAGDIDHDKATEALNALGAQGWELVSALDTQVSGGRTGRVTFVLKRPRAA
jgi:hypothetical protein